MRITTLRHPLSYTLTRDHDLVGTATILLPSVRAKAALDFRITPQVLESWPASVGQVDVRVRAIYGPAE